MENVFIKAERVVATALGLLVREVSLPALVWRDAGGDFAGAKDDTISIRLPSFMAANTRALRSGDARSKSNLHERKVDVTLDTDVYLDVPITDEQLTLDIADFGGQVLSPVMQGIALQLEQELADEIAGAAYDRAVTWNGSDDPYSAIALPARELLNKGHVPMGNRRLLVGSEIESAFLDSDKFVHADKSGSTMTLRESQIGRVAGFDVHTSNLISPDEAYAFHRTAYVLSNRAPVVPAGAPWGASQSFQGFAVRTVRVFDPDEVEDRFVADSWVGTNIVTDNGSIDAGDVFTPSEDPAATSESDLFIRSVQITTS
jgi:hypothetical protein